MTAPVEQLLSVREIGDITLVRILRDKILDETIVRILRDELHSLVDEQGRRKLLLDFSNVKYQSSAGLGPLISLSRRMAAVNGRLAFCAIHPSLFQVYEITRLALIFGMKDRNGEILDIPEAQALFKNHVAYRCPRPGCGGWSRSPNPRSLSVVPLQSCPFCAWRFYVSAANVPDVGESKGPVEEIIAESYLGENVTITMCENPWRMRINGRLDLFTMDVVHQVWEALPQPRVFVCDLDGITEISPRGAECLVNLFHAETAENDVLLESKKQTEDILSAFRCLAPVLSEKETRGAWAPSLVGAGEQPWVPLRVEE